MSARIFIHPRCMEGPAFGALQVTLEKAGYDMQRTVIGPSDGRGRRELIDIAWVEANGTMVYRRGDGTVFSHTPGQPAPEAA